jgi:hypothetical protein
LEKGELDVCDDLILADPWNKKFGSGPGSSSFGKDHRTWNKKLDSGAGSSS